MENRLKACPFCGKKPSGGSMGDRGPVACASHTRWIEREVWDNRAPAPSEKMGELTIAVVKAAWEARYAFFSAAPKKSKDERLTKAMWELSRVLGDHLTGRPDVALAAPEGEKPCSGCDNARTVKTLTTTEFCPKCRPAPELEPKSYICSNASFDHSAGQCPRCEVLP